LYLNQSIRIADVSADTGRQVSTSAFSPQNEHGLLDPRPDCHSKSGQKLESPSVSDQHRSRFLDFTLTDICATVLPAPLKHLRTEHLHVIRVTVTVIHDEIDLGPIELDCVGNWLGDKSSAIAGRLHAVQGTSIPLVELGRMLVVDGLHPLAPYEEESESHFRQASQRLYERITSLTRVKGRINVVEFINHGPRADVQENGSLAFLQMGSARLSRRQLGLIGDVEIMLQCGDEALRDAVSQLSFV